jgi:hypothetical protein
VRHVGEAPRRGSIREALGHGGSAEVPRPGGAKEGAATVGRRLGAVASGKVAV